MCGSGCGHAGVSVRLRFYLLKSSSGAWSRQFVQAGRVEFRIDIRNCVLVLGLRVKAVWLKSGSLRFRVKSPKIGLHNR